MRMQNRIAIVTGGAQGIGKEYCLGIAREGGAVVIADVDEQNGEKLAQSIKDSGGKALFVRTDVSSKADVEAMVKKTVEQFGGLDVLVNNAAILEAQPVGEISEELWDKQMAVNAKGTLFCAQAAAEVMKKQKRGKIVNISSIGALAAQPGLCAYHSTKAVVLTITRSFALELIKWNIQVNAVVPGTTNTGMAERAMKDPEFKKKVVDPIPAGRLGDPKELLGAVLYFATDDSNYCTGQTLIVDGGVLAII
jgi:NAD(P)-dependent dehydrogenase (short-subunit alcohol dehydrogenase family)